MEFNNSLQVMQLVVNELAGSSFVHKMQGQLFKSQGFEKLGQKYMDHYTEEMGWVEKFTNRMLDLGCVPQVKVCNETMLINDAAEYINADMKLQREGVDALYQMMPTLSADPTTYDIMKAYLADEEEDLYWDEEQVELIAQIGKQNWLVKQM